MRLRLLDAATEVLRRGGYANFRVQQVAQAAGVSRGAQLHHYPTKDGLVLAALERILARVRERSVDRARRAAQAGTGLEESIADAAAFYFGDDFFISLDIYILGGKVPQFRDKVRAAAITHLVPLEDAWETALTGSGMAPAQARDILFMTRSLVRGMAIRTLWQQDEVRFRALQGLWADMIDAYFRRTARPHPRGGAGRQGARER
jgi:AcrR family transcriptional regulator